MLAVPLTDYYEEVRRYLTCPEEVKDDLIYDVNRKVMDLNADRPDLDYDGILEFLGDPEDLANSLMEQMSDEVIQKYEKKKKRIRTGMILVRLLRSSGYLHWLCTLLTYCQMPTLLKKIPLSLLTRTAFLVLKIPSLLSTVPIDSFEKEMLTSK